MQDSCHNYGFLIRRWRAVAAKAKLRLGLLCEADGFPVYFLKTKPLQTSSGVYLSAGIHGDEPASCEGLIRWAEGNVNVLREKPLLILPCLNPWGLVMNSRFDSCGRDLNRLFKPNQHPTTCALKSLATAHEFAAALLLHEDYDARGIYLYELKNSEPIGETLLSAAESHIARDLRRKIDGRSASNGLIRPRFNQKRFELFGHPEAIWLHLQGCRRSVTFETPSEFSLEIRALAQEAALTALVGAH